MQHLSVVIHDCHCICHIKSCSRYELNFVFHFSILCGIHQTSRHVGSDACIFHHGNKRSVAIGEVEFNNALSQIMAMKHKVAIQVMKNQPPIIMINIQEGTLQIYCIINLEAKRFEWHGFLSIEYHQHRWLEWGLGHLFKQKNDLLKFNTYMLGLDYEHVNSCQAHGDYFIYHKMPCVQFTKLLLWLCETLRRLFNVNIFLWCCHLGRHFWCSCGWRANFGKLQLQPWCK